jgi:signal peptidase I
MISPSESWLSESHALKCELAGEVLRSSGQLRLQVTGWSMLPSIWPGDVLLIERASPAEVSEGDIVLYRLDRRLMVHRVVAKVSAPGDVTLLTRGDAMPATDPSLPDSALLGRVSLIVRNGRNIRPKKSPGISQRATAALVQHSGLAARVVVRVHDMLQPSKVQASQVQTAQVQIQNGRAVPCQH